MNNIIKLKESDIVRSHPRLTVISSKIVKKNPPMRELTLQERLNEDTEIFVRNLQRFGEYCRNIGSSEPYKATSISRADVLIAQKNHKMRLKKERRDSLISVAINTALICGTAFFVLQVLIMAIEELGA